MSDKEPLELAAKAAGIEGVWDNESKCFVPADGPIIWEPLSHDGDALRLAVKLGIDLIQHNRFSDGLLECCAWSKEADKPSLEKYDGDPYAATRRAIVRAAAAIGEQMK